MNYLEIKFTLDLNFRDIIIAELSEIGFDTFLETETGFNTYTEQTGLDPVVFDPVVEQYRELVEIKYEMTTFPDKNWNEEWEKNFDPIMIEDKCLIRAPFHQIDQSFELEILIEPKMAFGTGHHATTYLMIQEMMAHQWGEKRVLDLGCGTGILSIVAVKLGASEVWATDINDWSIDNSNNNFRLNDCNDIRLQCGQINELEIPSGFHYVLANINRNVLLEEIPDYKQKLDPKGLLFLSGFYEEDQHLITNKLESCGMKVLSNATRNDWSLLTCALA